MDDLDEATGSVRTLAWRHLLLGAVAWAGGWAAMILLDGHVELGNLSMLLVLASATASVWFPMPVSIVASIAAVLAFNWLFVPPRGTFTVNVRQDAILLLAMVAVTSLVTGLMAAQRAAADRARWHARHADQMRRLGDALRDVADPVACATLLRTTLEATAGASAVMLLLRRSGAALNGVEQVWIGTPNAEQRVGLEMCARDCTALGPGTGRYAELPELYLPLRGREAGHGAAVLEVGFAGRADEARRAQAQALCDQMGLALERAATARVAAVAQENAQLQAVRATLLAAISHEYRTPLATIMSAASSLAEQDGRLHAEQRRKLAETIVEETLQLGRMTDNTLQLARLDAPRVDLGLEWESAEEIVGTCLRRARRHDGGRRVRARLEPSLPLVRCDARLLAQLLDNLVDNALKYSQPPSPVELLVRRQGSHIVFAVRDRGGGIPLAERDRIFEAFERGASTARATRGVGVGLAVCRAIARAHGGELKLRARTHGGTSFECWLPEAPPPRIEAEADATACHETERAAGRG